MRTKKQLNPILQCEPHEFRNPKSQSELYTTVYPTDYVVGLVFTTVNGSGHSSQVSYSGTGLVIALPHIL